MLDLLILAAKNNKMNNNDIKEEVDTFMFEVSMLSSPLYFRKTLSGDKQDKSNR